LALQSSEFDFAKAAFEIAIVAIGVLLALAVDEARQRRSDRALVDEVMETMETEIDQNRVRLATKLLMLHRSYEALEGRPAAGPKLVEQRTNMQIALADAAWIMALQTGALRLMDQDQRRAFTTIYLSHVVYNSLLTEEMGRWTELAASSADDRAVQIWKAYARRLAAGACYASIRIERFRNSQLPTDRLVRACEGYRLSVPPDQLYRQFGVDVPNMQWRPGREF
jgi:hypothetical protein